jgi:hypothetical protein
MGLASKPAPFFLQTDFDRMVVLSAAAPGNERRWISMLRKAIVVGADGTRVCVTGGSDSGIPSVLFFSARILGIL